ncbi:MAG: hypothetical protein ACON3Z_15695 [Bradymonadia bacterium]
MSYRLGRIWLMLSVMAATSACPSLGFGRVSWSTPGSYRLWLVERSPFTVDAAATEYPRAALALHRLRLQPQVNVGQTLVRIEFDVLSGQIFGTTTSVASSESLRQDSDPSIAYDGWVSVLPRQAWFSYKSDYFSLKAGQFADHWGFGLIQNSGYEADEKTWLLRPGGNWSGDLVDRVDIAITPLNDFFSGSGADLSVFAGAGTVFHDERTHVLDGTSVSSAIAGIQYRDDVIEAGFRYGYREEEEENGDAFERHGYGVFGHAVVPLYLSNAKLRVGLEGYFADAQRLTASGAVDNHGYAVIGRTEYRWNCPRLAFGIDFGRVSGDRPSTTQDEALTTDPGYRVGFIMFSDAMRVLTAREAELSRGRGVDDFSQPTHGGLRNTQFVQLGVSWQPDEYEVGLTLLKAWTDEPTYSRLNTSAPNLPVDHFGAAESVFYGTEGALSLRYRPGWPGFRSLNLGMDAGALLPGPSTAPSNELGLIAKFLWRIELGW